MRREITTSTPPLPPLVGVVLGRINRSGIMARLNEGYSDGHHDVLPGGPMWVPLGTVREDR